MTIQHSIDTMQAWTHGLRILMGYPVYAPIGNPVIFASGGHRDALEALEIATIVEETGCDIVYVEFSDPIADGPIGVSLATRATLQVDWHPRVRLYAASDDAPAELLTDTQRWSVGPRSVLTSWSLPAQDQIMRGVERANRRWRETAEQIYGVELTGSCHVPAGGSYAGAVPMEALYSAS